VDLFSNLELGKEAGPPRPLADRMRPATLEEFVGQQHLLASGKPLRTQIERDEISSLILWGPPGVGKTTLASIIAQRCKGFFVRFSAVLSGIKEVKAVMEEAAMARRGGTRTILFVDEIHRFNKAQQDAFLPHVEKGDIILIGATTENPSFEVISALLSRSRVYHLAPLETEDIQTLLRRALSDKERGLGDLNVEIAEPLLHQIATFANGDARIAYNVLETVVQGTQRVEGKSGSRPNSWQRRWSARRCFTTRRERSISISSQRCTSRCGTAIRTRRSTGWRGCWSQEKIPCTWRGDWCASQART